MRNIDTIRPHELTAEHRQAWRRLLSAQPGLDSPFFDPVYVEILGEHRKQIEIGVVSDATTPIGFFPFERHQQTIAKPLGVKLCDLQGVIVEEDMDLSVDDVLRGCGLTSWCFDHRLVSTPASSRATCVTSHSPFMDLSNGFDEYVESWKQSGSSQRTQIRRKQRKLERERGPIRFEWHTHKEAVFDQLMAWKRAQRERTRTFDILQFEWVVSALKSIWQTRSNAFSGILSAMYVGDRLVAAHLGMCTSTVFHHWFPSYDREFYRYSPGLILLLEMAQAAAGRGIHRLDLGKGPEQYKSSFASGVLPIDEGVVELRPVRALIGSAALRTREWIKSSPLYRPAQIPKRWIRRLQHQAAMQ